MEISLLKTEDVTYLEDILLYGDGTLKVVPYEKLKDVPQEHISLFCVKHGVYCVPTQELIDFLASEIKGKEKDTIEVGAGNGAIGRDLGITCTDSYMQNRPEVKAMYELAGQAVVKYGEHVRIYDALEAVRRYRPKIVIGAWCTHKYNPKEHWREGNQWGFEEDKILAKIDKYIHIGNEKIHGTKPILCKQHRTVKAEWLVSRSMSKDKNVIWIWD